MSREDWEATTRADYIWIHNWSPHLPPIPSVNKPIIRSHYRAVSWLHKGKSLPLSSKTGDTKAIVGISVASGFWTALSQLKLNVTHYQQLGNHAPIKTNSPNVVMTEKDAARLPIQAPIWALQMELVVEGAQGLLEDIKKWSC